MLPPVVHSGIARRGPTYAAPTPAPPPISGDGSSPLRQGTSFLHLQDLSVQHKVSVEIC